PGMEAMWRCAVETRQPMCCLINPHDLPAVDQMCTRFPETPVVIDHVARIGIDGKMRRSDLNHLCRLARHQHVYVKLSAYYALGKKTPPYDDLGPMIQQVYNAFGPQRLMWASDCPYQLDNDHTYQASLSLIRDRLDFLSAEDRDWLLSKTAEKVFFAGNA
ncbi:MAG: amidohydrolase, partial [Pirellulales bacterium]|nr:amidohydrolase [Pirellulales bacterium]